MADDSEKKIEALKKAYAEIILKSSKEAAARIMMADRKARCFEQQLVSLKEDSLSMLLRLKDQFNSMVMETEAKSLKQQMKIDELEAQLNEAEGIIVDLRSELNQVQEQLEIERQNQRNSLNEHILVTNEPVQECAPPDTVCNSSVIPQIQDSQFELVDYEKKIASVHPRLLINKVFQIMDSTNYSVESHVDKHHAPDDDFSSIIIQNRETDLCKNRCTQRIRAFEGNLSNVGHPTSPSEDEKFLSHKPLIYGEKRVNSRQHASDKVDSCWEPLCSFETDKSNAKNISFGWLKQQSTSCKHKAIRSRRSARKNAKYREAIASLQSSHKKFRKPQLKPFRSPLKRCSNVVNVETVEIPIGLIQLNHNNTKFSHVPESDNLNCNSENYVACASSDESNGAPDDTLLDSALVDVPILEGFGSSHCQLSRADKFLKFTFQRKRRKNILGKIDENIPRDKVPMKRLENPADVAMVEIGILKDRKYEDYGKMNQMTHELISSSGVQC